ncbi:hypothetical protein [Shewanella sp. 125m-3]
MFNVNPTQGAEKPSVKALKAAVALDNTADITLAGGRGDKGHGSAIDTVEQ